MFMTLHMAWKAILILLSACTGLLWKQCTNIENGPDSKVVGFLYCIYVVICDSKLFIYLFIFCRNIDLILASGSSPCGTPQNIIQFAVVRVVLNVFSSLQCFWINLKRNLPKSVKNLNMYRSFSFIRCCCCRCFDHHTHMCCLQVYIWVFSFWMHTLL